MVSTRIQAHFSQMSIGQKKLAKYITSNFENAVYMNVRQLAADAGVSEASVVRFAVFLGYEGFREMQRDIRKEVESNRSIAERFKVALALDNESLKDTEQIYNQAITNLNETVRQIPDELYDQTIDLICSARRIGVVTSRAGVGPGITLQILLNQLIPSCQLLIPGFDTSFDTIANWDERDLLICFSYMAKKNFIFDMASYGKEKGCKIVSICDGYRNSIAALSDIMLPVQSESAFLSFVPTMYVIDTLLYKLSKSNKIDHDSRIKEVDQIYDRFINHS